ncbi:phosphoenolpyruvate carboxylase [Thalassomonas sp. M1454]|uniref:phosphoenolpyruvate carboxylase n=1 Tax=Thalassomonas sp. M1454 TaxID=2594477 RepID=UPI00117E2BF8|nr:phosphoenolpyruvate carboxylase [Thalassomonas sp. M1454]TRX57048.1 phosphoenolpyruvate carboxylase [Thalassomonas sp. M1454]
MSQPLHIAGVKFLKALAKHSDIIMQAYLSGRVNELEHDAKVLDKLIGLGVLWRPEPSEDLRLRSSIRSLLENNLRDERNRQLDANIGSKLAAIKTITSHYKEALHHQNYVESEVYMEDLTEQVYGLVDSLKSNVRNLWRRIHNEFGYVGSINAKIRENELAQSQLTDMRKQLAMFQFDELADIAGSSRELRRLLVVHLQRCHSEISQELSIAQSKLIDLLGKFREYLHRSQLLKGYVLHCQQKPDYHIKNYAELNTVPPLFNQAEAILKPASIDVNNIEHERLFGEIVSHLKQVRHSKTNKNERGSQSFNLNDIEEINIESDELKQAVEQYFCQVIDTGNRLSALEFYQQQNLELDQEEWIYGVINGFYGLSIEEQDFFQIGPLGHPHPLFDGNYIIEDVELGLR